MLHWLRTKLIGREAADLRRLLRESSRRCAALERARRAQETALAQREIEFEEAAEALRGELASTSRLVRQYDEELEKCRSQLKVAEEVTIPTLVEAHRLLLERWRGESAIHVRRQVAAMPGGGDE